MEKVMEKRHDAIMEHELQVGYRIKRVPEAIVREWAQECGKAPVRVRFTRINPGRRRKIAEVVVAQYHKDLNTPGLLSHAQVLKLVTDRGEWSDALQAEMEDLRTKTTQEMGLLFMNGDVNNDWSVKVISLSAAFREAIERIYANDLVKQSDVFDRFSRWVEYTPEYKELYTSKYAKEQGRETYSPDYDLQRLFEACAGDEPGSTALEELDRVLEKLIRFQDLQKKRLRLRELQLKASKMFADTVEQRRDNVEELARMFFTVEALDEKNVVLGPLADSFDGVFNLPQTAIDWLLTEAYFVQNNIPDEAREYLETFGFLAAEGEEKTTDLQPGESVQSDESPAPQTSKPGSARPVTASDVSA